MHEIKIVAVTESLGMRPAERSVVKVLVSWMLGSEECLITHADCPAEK